MSHDVLIGSTNRDWSRQTAHPSPPPAVSGAEPSSPQADAGSKIAKLMSVKTAADCGDNEAQKKWRKIFRKFTKLQKKADGGNTKAANVVKMLATTNLFTTPPTTSRGEFIGKNELLGMDEILGSQEFVGEEERALAAEGGACERAALRRRVSQPLATQSGYNGHLAFVR